MSDTRRRGLDRLLGAEIVAVGLLTQIAALGFGSIFDGTDYLWPVVGAAVGGAVLSAVSSIRRFSLSGSLLLSVLGFVAYSTYAILGDTAPNIVPTLSSFRELGEGLTGAWADLLTINLPTRAEPRLLVLAAALIWFPAALGVHLAVRARSVAAPVLPTLASYVVVLGFAVSQPRQAWGQPGAMAVLVLVIVLLHGNRWAVLEPGGLRVRRVETASMEPSLERPARRWVVLGLPIIAVAVLGGLAVSVYTPERPEAFDPRTLRSQEVTSTGVESPLAGLKDQLVRPEPRLLFRLITPSVQDARSIPRVRLAVLDRFDGATWSSSARYTQAGSELRAGPEVTIPRREVRQTYHLEAAGPGPWVPAADRPVSIAASPSSANDGTFAIDDERATLIVTSGGRVGLTYDVTSLVPLYDDAALEFLVPPSGEAAREATRLPEGLPEQIPGLAVETTASASSPFGKLRALEEALSTTYGYNDQVPSGSSYGRLSGFLADRTGYAEQFAAAFAVMARSLGYPARLSFGYLTVTSDAGQERETLTEITDRQAHVWPEVWLQGAGWVPFEPTPPRVESTPPEEGQSPAVIPDGSAFAESATGDTGESAAGNEEVAPPGPSRLDVTTLVALVLLSAVMMLVMLLLLLKAVRRRQRRRVHQSTVLQVLGAWADVTDRLLELGVPVRRSMTAKEVVQLSTERVAEEASARLAAMAPLVTLALFAPVSPSFERAQEMWMHADAFRREVLRGQHWYHAIFAYVNPRPFLDGFSPRDSPT